MTRTQSLNCSYDHSIFIIINKIIRLIFPFGFIELYEFSIVYRNVNCVITTVEISKTVVGSPVHRGTTKKYLFIFFFI